MALLGITAEAPLGLRLQYLFFGQWAQCVRAGIPILLGIRHVRDAAGNARLRRIADGMTQTIEIEHRSISEAFGRHMPHLSPFYLALIEQGEASGKLDSALGEIAEDLRSRIEIQNEILSAGAYPATIFVLFLVMWPLPYLFNEGTTTYLLYALPPIVGVSLVVAFAFLVWPRLMFADSVVSAVDRLKLGFPFARQVFRGLAVARFARALELLTRAGIAADRALEIAGAASGNAYLAHCLTPAVGAVRQGRPLSQALSATGMFDATFIGMMSTGEKSGELDRSLGSVATLYEGSAQTGIRAAVKVTGPILQVVVGAVIAVYVINFYLSRLSVLDAIR